MVIVLGKSKHLNSIIKKIEGEKIEFGWRSILKKQNQKNFSQLKNVTKIYILGFDFSTFLSRFETCTLTNIINPSEVVFKLLANNPKAEVVYLTTRITTNTKTYSRYLFCKQNLGHMLSKINNAYIIELNTIISNDMTPIVRTGMFARLIFSFLIKTKRISTCTLSEVEHKIRNYKSVSVNPTELIPCYLWVPRSQFLDKALRYVLR